MKECKYRLPCDWCDKFDKKCEEVDYHKLQCEHDWTEENTHVYLDEENVIHYTTTYVCRKCRDRTKEERTIKS